MENARPAHCADCGAAPLKAGADPDGSWRCFAHSQRPEAVEKRAAAGKAGAVEGRRRKQIRQEMAPSGDSGVTVDFKSREGAIATLEALASALAEGRMQPQQAVAAAKIAEAAIRAHSISTGKKGPDGEEEAPRARRITFQLVTRESLEQQRAEQRAAAEQQATEQSATAEQQGEEE